MFIIGLRENYQDDDEDEDEDDEFSLCQAMCWHYEQTPVTSSSSQSGVEDIVAVLCVEKADTQRYEQAC